MHLGIEVNGARFLVRARVPAAAQPSAGT